MKKGIQWSIYAADEINLIPILKEKYLSGASSTAPNLQPVGKVAVEYPKNGQ